MPGSQPQWVSEILISHTGHSVEATRREELLGEKEKTVLSLVAQYPFDHIV